MFEEDHGDRDAEHIDSAALAGETVLNAAGAGSDGPCSDAAKDGDTDFRGWELTLQFAIDQTWDGAPDSGPHRGGDVSDGGSDYREPTIRIASRASGGRIAKLGQAGAGLRS